MQSLFPVWKAVDVSFGVAQISAMGRTELDKVQERIEPKLEQMMGEKQIQMRFMRDMNWEALIQIQNRK